MASGYPSVVNHEVDPVSRIEGHLGLALNVSGGKVAEANAHGNMWRGFENFLIGREPNDAITFTQRICGVCPVPHGMTSTYAVDSVLGYSKGHITFAEGTLPSDGMGVPAKAVAIRNLVLSSEHLMSSITHFYHLVAPSYVQGPAIPPWTPYFADAQYATALKSGNRALPTRGADGTYSNDVWSTVIRSYVRALRVRRLTFEAAALFAGRMPMTSCFVAGGVSNNGQEDLSPRIAKFKEIMTEVGLFIIQEYVPIVLALGLLYGDYDNPYNSANALTGALNANGGGFGASVGRFLAWGAFPSPSDGSGTLGMPGGYVDTATSATTFIARNKQEVYDTFLATSGNGSVSANLLEDIAWSRYAVSDLDVATYGSGTAAYPGDVARTRPNRQNGYTYMKAPRWNGMSAEVGPLATMVVAGLYPVSPTSGSTGTVFLNPAGNALQQFYSSYALIPGAGSGTLETTGLDPRMVYPDIAVALVRAGLAELWSYVAAVGAVKVVQGSAVTTGATYTTVGIDNAIATVDVINEAYSYSGPSTNGLTRAFITGPILGWIAGLAGGLSTIDRIRGRAFAAAVLVQRMLGTYDKTTGPGWSIPTGTWSTSGTYGGTGGTTGTTHMASYAGTFSSASSGLLGGGWINDSVLTTTSAGSTWRNLGSVPTTEVHGWGATEAPRGALMHQITINNGKIEKYQCIVPTTWNGSPKDSQWASASGSTVTASQHRGPFEEACMNVTFMSGSTTYSGGSVLTSGYIGTAGQVTAANGGVEVVRCVQSFDPCIACAVH